MKKCARCDREYDDAYDGCPTCPRITTRDAWNIAGAAVLALLVGPYLVAWIVAWIVSLLAR